MEVQISVNKCTFVVAQNDFSTLHIEEEKAEIMLKTTEGIKDRLN